jgi:Phosphotransferase enzyme family
MGHALAVVDSNSKLSRWTDSEVALTGGRQSSGVIRIGDTVHRPMHDNSVFVHQLLRHLERVGFGVGPENVGDPVPILSDAKLASAARLIRRFHDATAGTPLADPGEVVCHTDLGQHNIVFRGDEAVGIIDWDEDVHPGSRLFDLAHAVWCLAEIGKQGGDLLEQAHRISVLCDNYGWADSDPVIDEIEGRFRRAIASHEQAGRNDSAQILSTLLNWLLANGPTIRAAARAT